MPAHVRVGTLKTYIDGTRPPANCTASLEGRFRTLLSVSSNLATLNPNTAVMQQRASTWVDFISPCGHQSLYIYNKVYTLQRCTLFAYIAGKSRVVVWVYISAGVGRLNVAYPYLEAMLRPEDWDKRERSIFPRLFCFHTFFVNK